MASPAGSPIQPFVEPRPRALVLGEPCHRGIDQDVNVDQHLLVPRAFNDFQYFAYVVDVVDRGFPRSKTRVATSGAALVYPCFRVSPL